MADSTRQEIGKAFQTVSRCRVLSRERLSVLLWSGAGLVITLAAWSTASALLGPRRLPSPQDLWPSVITDLYTNTVLAFQGGGDRGLLPHLLYTIRQTLLGCATGGVVGTLLGLAIARWSPLALFTEIPIGALRAVPPLAAIPFMVLWFGPLPEAQLGAVAFYTALMMVVTTTTAVGNLDPLAQRFARTLGARDGHVFRTVVLPSIIPELIGGLRVATGIAWGIEVVSELAGAPRGMGQVFSRMISFQELSVIIVGIFWITVVATITDGFILAFARYATRWTPR